MSHKFALVGDLHYGSTYRRDDLIHKFYRRAKKFGATKAYQVGDLLEGDYRHHRPEDLDAWGFDDQAKLFIKKYPKGLPTDFIEGNHDEKFDKQGVRPGAHLEMMANAKGHQLTFLGKRRAFVNHGGLKICLFHPSFGQCKASSLGFNPVRIAPMSKLERFLASVRETENPDIVAIGHWHQHSYFHYRGMHVFLCGTFQGPGGAFGNSLDSTPSVGSWLVEAKKTKSGAEVTPTLVKYGT